jgi:hypothetical protein
MTDTTEKTTTSKEKLGPPFPLRIFEWQEKACEYIAHQDSLQNFIPVGDRDVKRAMLKHFGFQAFCKARGLPTTKEGWDQLYKKSIKEAVAEVNEE